MHPLERRILTTLKRRSLVAPGSRGLVCVSGGADSLALLHLLGAAAPALRLSLEVVHFDHGLRPESAREADVVAAHAAGLELPCHVVRSDRLAGLGRGVQAAARDWRRAEALRLAAQWDARWIATGHQRDDQVETVLLKLLRGAHVSGLQGMAWLAPPFVRPLLEIGHAELCAYLTDRGAAWLEDPSNADSRYKRSRVRHEAVPLLNGLAGGRLAERIGSLSAQSEGVAELLAYVRAEQPVSTSAPDAAEHWMDADRLAALPGLAAAAHLHAFVLERLPGALDAAQVDAALSLLRGGGTTWRLDLSHGRRLVRRGERLLLERQGSAGAPTRRHELGGYGVTAPAHWRVVGADADAAQLVTLYNLPAGAELVLRTRAAGDRFHPAWRERPLKLGEFLRAQGVPREARESLPVIVLEGRVIAVPPRFVARGHDVPLGEATPPLRLGIAVP